MSKLTDILTQGTAESLREQWGETEAAGEFDALPAGEYNAHIIKGELETSRSKATPGYKLTFRIIDGPHEGRQFWNDIWLTEAALPMAKRDLQKIGVTELDQLEKPLPHGIRCKVKLSLRRDDNGAEFNKVRRFDVVGIDEPEQDDFAPDDSDGGAE